MLPCLSVREKTKPAVAEDCLDMKFSFMRALEPAKCVPNVRFCGWNSPENHERTHALEKTHKALSGACPHYRGMGCNVPVRVVTVCIKSTGNRNVPESSKNTPHRPYRTPSCDRCCRTYRLGAHIQYVPPTQTSTFGG